MQIPVYLAVNQEDFTKQPKIIPAQVGFGFYPNGSVRLPKKLIAQAITVIDDLYMPNMSQSAIQMLQSKITNGCILDFEHSPTKHHIKLIEGLSKIVALPEKFIQYASKAYPIITSAEPCNSWQQFLRKAQAKYPRGWFLEIVPWKHLSDGTAMQEEGYLRSAMCRYRKEGNQLLYFDTKETIHQKLSIAQSFACRGVLCLLSEMRQLK